MGLPQLTLVAVGDLCVPSIEFTLLEPERIERLVLVPSGRVEETGLSGALSSTLGSADVEMLVVRRDFPSAERDFGHRAIFARRKILRRRGRCSTLAFRPIFGALLPA